MNRGVTLIELIVVMALVSVMLAVVGPSVSGGIDNLILASEGQRVVSAFRLAQASAKSTGEQIFATHDESILRFIKSDQPYETVILPRSVRFVTTERAFSLAFLENGQIVGADVLELTNSRGRRVQLSINHATGLIKVVREP